MKNAIRIDSLSNLIPNKENPEYLCNFKEYDWTFDYFAHITGQKNLIVFFSGLIPVQKMKRIVPYFSKWSWGKFLYNYDIIAVSDPGLYLDNKIVGCWGQGFLDDWILLKILKHIMYIQQKNSYNRIIFNGNSQGGFLSIQAAILLPNIPPPPHTQRSALIQFVAENPQISLKNYWKTHTTTLAKVCFGKNNIDEVPKKYLYRLDIVELIKKYNYVPNGLIVIKESDTHHYNVHIKYLQDNIPAQQRNNLKIEVIPASIDNTGHTPLNLEQFKQRLEYLDIMANMYKNYDKYYY